MLGKGSQPYREFALTPGGVLALLKETGDRFLAAGGLVGGSGIVLLLVTAALWRRWRALALLLPALSAFALFLVPAGYVYPRFTLPLCLCAAVAMSWALAHVPGGASRRQRAWLGVLVALWSIGEASGVVEAKREDARPRSVAALASRRAEADEVWICPQPWFFAPFPPIAPPHRYLTLAEAALALKRGEPRPRFLWLAVDPHVPLAAREALERTAASLKMRLVERFTTEPRAPLANDPAGLLLPVVALFERVAE